MDTTARPVDHPGSITGERELVARMTWLFSRALAESTDSTSMFRYRFRPGRTTRGSLVGGNCTCKVAEPGDGDDLAARLAAAADQPQRIGPLGASYLHATPAGAPVRQTFDAPGDQGQQARLAVEQNDEKPSVAREQRVMAACPAPARRRQMRYFSGGRSNKVQPRLSGTILLNRHEFSIGQSSSICEGDSTKKLSLSRSRAALLILQFGRRHAPANFTEENHAMHRTITADV